MCICVYVSFQLFLSLFLSPSPSEASFDQCSPHLIVIHLALTHAHRYYRDLKPHVHYVPVAGYTVADLQAAITYCRTHDTFASWSFFYLISRPILQVSDSNDTKRTLVLQTVLVMNLFSSLVSHALGCSRMHISRTSTIELPHRMCQSIANAATLFVRRLNLAYAVEQYDIH